MEEFDQAEFSPSYKDNLPKENLVLQYAENFRRQMVQLYRDRKPLFLNPVNECGVEVRISQCLDDLQRFFNKIKFVIKI